MAHELETLPQRSVEEMFVAVVTASAPLVGETYFDKVPKILADAWGAAAFITEIDASEEANACQMLGVSRLDTDPRERPRLYGEPWCGDATNAAIYHAPRVGALFSNDALLRDAEVYLAVPLVDSLGSRIGYVGLIDSVPWSAAESAAAESLLRLVAPRAAAELERHRLQERLLVELRNFHELAAVTDEGFLSWTGGRHVRIVYLNGTVERLTGYTEQEVRLNPGALVAQIVGSALPLEGGAPSSAAVIPLQRKDGHETPVEVTLTIDRSSLDVPMYRCILRAPSDGVRLTASDDARQAAVLRQLPFAAIVLRDDDVVFMNDRAREVTGASPADLLERVVSLNDSRGEMSVTIREFARRVSASRSSRVMLKLKLRRGHERLIQMRVHRIDLPDGPALILAPLDLTHEQLIREQLEHRAGLYERIVTSLPADIVVIDAAGRITALTNRLSESSESAHMPAMPQPPLAVGDDYLEVYRQEAGDGPQDWRDVLRGVGSVLSRSAPAFAKQYEVTDDQGNKRSLLFAAAALEGGGAIISHSDITMLKRGEHELIEREAHERTLLQQLPDQLARISSEGVVHEVLMPAPVSHMVSPLPRAPMGRNVRDLLPREAAERLQKAIRDSMQANVITSCILRLPYGEDEREYEMRIVPSTPDESLVYVRDRTADQWSQRRPDDDEHGERRRVVRENPYGLTFREVAVLEHMAQGASDKEIASTLGVSVFTVYKHVSKILHKMNAPSRTEASLRTVREHLFN